MTRPRHELSHPVRLDRLGAAPMTVVLEPDQGVRAALAERFELQEIGALRAELSVHRRPESGWIELSGSVTADVVQTCVVTTEPVEAQVETEILELFDDSGEVAVDEVVVDPMADAPEPISGDTLDVGEVAAQAFGLALDPYPRAPGAAPEVTGAGPDDGAATASPFAKLAALKGRSVKKG